MITPGTGKAKPSRTDLVTVHYTGWTTDGKMFDSSVARGKPATLPAGPRDSRLDRGVQLMVQGEKRRLWIPEPLAYKGTREPQGHARVRHRADRRPQPSPARADRREGAAVRREEDGERARLQGAEAGHRRAAPEVEQPGDGALHRLDDRREDVRQLGRARGAGDVSARTA